MAAMVIPTPAGIAVPSATAEVVGEVGRYYSWFHSVLVNPGISYANISATTAIAFPLVIPFDGTWDQVALVSTQTDITGSGYRIALYEGDVDNGNMPPTEAGSILAEVLVPTPTVSGVEELITAVISITNPAGTVVWCYFALNDTDGVGTDRVAVLDGAQSAVFGIGSDHVFDIYGMNKGARRNLGGRVGGTAFGNPPPDAMAAPYTDRPHNLIVPVVQFRLGAI